MSASETPLTDSKTGYPDCYGKFSRHVWGNYVEASDCRAIERRLNACVDALEDLLEPPAFRHEVFAAEQKANEAIANARKPLP